MYKLRMARGATMTLLAALMLGGCMQATLAPTPEASWKTRDRELMSNLPYKQAAIPEEFRRHIVDYSRKEAPGTIVVDTDNKFLYYVLPKGQAIRYGVTVGEEGQAWGGIATVGRMEEWPPCETDRWRTGAAWSLARLRDRRTAKSDGFARALSIPRWQGYAVPYPWYQPARIHRPSQIIGLHPLDQRGCDRPLQSRQGRHNCCRPRANKPLLVIRSPWGRWPQRLNGSQPSRIR